MKAVLAALACAALGAPALADNLDLQAQLRVCAGCHGAEAAAATRGPELAGQKLGYLRKQLHEFRSGARIDPQMSPIARPLTDALIDALAEHYAALPRPVSNTRATMDPTTPPLVFCVRCHGESGVSPNDIWPSLSALDPQYMRKQVEAYSRGERRDDMMANWGQRLKGDDLERILEYFAGR